MEEMEENDCPSYQEFEAHNATIVTALHLQVVNIPAEDYIKDRATGQMVVSTQTINRIYLIAYKLLKERESW